MCDCEEARKWREEAPKWREKAFKWDAYWEPAAIEERLREELEAENRRCLERWTAAMNDVRGYRRIEDVPVTWNVPSYADLELARHNTQE